MPFILFFGLCLFAPVSLEERKAFGDEADVARPRGAQSQGRDRRQAIENGVSKIGDQGAGKPRLTGVGAGLFEFEKRRGSEADLDAVIAVTGEVFGYEIRGRGLGCSDGIHVGVAGLGSKLAGRHPQVRANNRVDSEGIRVAVNPCVNDGQLRRGSRF